MKRLNGQKKPKFNNILCIRQDNLGDVLMTTPAFKALKKTFPGAKLTLLASEMGAPIAKFIPEVDETIVFTPPWVKSEKEHVNLNLLNIVARIKKAQFDLAVIFTNFSQNPLPFVLIPYLAGVPRRLSYCRENPYQLLTDWYPDSEPFSKVIHGVKRQLKLVEAIGAKTRNTSLSLQVPEAAVGQVLKKLEQAGVNINKPWVIVHPGAGEQKRRFPTDLFAESIKIIATKLKKQIVITGIEKESRLADIILQQCPFVYSLVGKLDLAEMIGLISISPLLLSNNTGPAHIAAAVNTPVVVLYARTNPEHTPWIVKSETLFFDYSENLKSKNEILKYTFPRKRIPAPLPEEIFQACSRLLGEFLLEKQERKYGF